MPTHLFFCSPYDRWSWLPYALVMIVVYPIGIPAAFFFLVRRNLGRLREPDIRMTLGFLYEAYDHDMYWFELMDMTNKLFMTSVMPLFAVGHQVPGPLLACILPLLFPASSCPAVSSLCCPSPFWTCFSVLLVQLLWRGALCSWRRSLSACPI